MQNSKSNRFGVIIIFTLMFLSPFIENTRGIFIPIFKEDFSVTNTAVSSMITIVSLAGMSVTLLGGAVIERIGQKKTIIIGILCLITGILIQSQAASFPMFFIGFIPIIAGINIYGVAANTVVPILFAGTSTLAMNLLHFMYGAGSTVSQNSIGLLLERNISWRTMYVFIALFYFIVLIGIRFAKIPDEPQVRREKGQNSILKNPLLYVFGLAMGFYAFAEQGMSLWLTNYLKDGFGFRESVGARYLGIFFFVFAFGRLVGGFIVQKTGVLRTVMASQVISLILMGLGFLLGVDYIIIISISGLFFAIVFPSLMSLVSLVFKERPGFATGFIMTMVALVLNLMNLLMGILTDAAGPKTSIYLLPLSMLISIGFVAYIRIRAGKDIEKVKQIQDGREGIA
ncbi:MFS transporter [Proteiniclasticum sp.]|uniref:MFS transporter n=1 Tax=Proteiniclasticum sp. TaxID=2053595 RepID=UPI0028980CDB|nr:MFS transporter [Proteiniclasticum sp.]